MRHGDLDQAFVDVDRASVEYAGNLEWSWMFRILKAHLFAVRRDYKSALQLLADPLPDSLANSEVAARKLMVEGISYRLDQQFAISEQKFRDAITMAESHHPELLAEVLNSFGGLQFYQVQLDDARQTFLRSLALSRQYRNQATEVNALATLAMIATQQEHYDEAVEYNQSALRLARSLDMGPTADVIIGNLGWNYQALGDYANALPLFQQAADAAAAKNLVNYQAHWLASVGDVYYAEHDFANAEITLRRAFALSRTLDDRSSSVECLNLLAMVDLEVGHVDSARKFNEEALAIQGTGDNSAGIIESQLIRARVDTASRSFEEARQLYSKVLANKVAEKPLQWAAEAGLAENFDAAGQDIQADKQYRQAIHDFDAARQAIVRDEFRISFLSTRIDFYDNYLDFLVAHHRERDALHVAELTRSRVLAEGLNISAASMPTVSDPQQIARKLQKTLLYYWIGHQQSHLWVISASKLQHFSLPRAAQVSPLVDAYRKAVRDLRDSEDPAAEPGRKLYAMLVAPAQNLIPPDSRITLLPDPSLASLNFETLVVDTDKPHFWIDDVTLSSASSLSLLAASTTHPAPKENSLLLIGNTEPVEAFPALPKAAEEMQRVEHYFPEAQRTVLEGKQATPQAFLSANAGRFSHLHFVTHGTASTLHPLDSAVILSRSGDVYKLYARDIVHQPLSAQLVTISACEGAAGRAYSGEGLVGLSWAFLRAGAHNVVGALWEVNDSAAPQIMETFYAELSRGRDPATALRTAKLALLHNPDREIVFRKPFYWAPFQLYSGS